ncbi:MAG: hypothetical protein ABI162_01050 [Luteolibacter sp.]
MKRILLAASGLIAAAEAGPSVEGKTSDGLRSYEMHSSKKLRDDFPAGGVLSFSENPADPQVITGNSMIDAVHALACYEARLNAVNSIRDAAYQNGEPIPLNAYQTGERWTYVWTRDLAYATDLGLAAMDPQRTRESLFFKTSGLKPGITGGATLQIVQDTGSGGSWPVSSDRVIWALGLRGTIKFLSEPQRSEIARQGYAILNGTLRQDENVLRDSSDGLFHGEQSFLDWREQSYPKWTADNVGAIAATKALSTNIAFAIAMETAGELGKLTGQPSDWLEKSKSLKSAIQKNFYDPEAGEYSAYLLRDGLSARRSSRRDLLGTSLAILEGIPTREQAVQILSRYPIGPHGPPVVSPQEPGIPIYHNCAMWPFVTAYWTRAAAYCGHAEAVASGIDSILKGAEENLSNMENLDFVTGDAFASHLGIEGPVVNSRRQIWSVAGALGVFHSVIFGMETNFDGIRFLPKIPARTARSFGSKNPELRNLTYLGKQIDITLEVPDLAKDASGFLTVVSITLNGKALDDSFVSPQRLDPKNHWDVRLGPPLTEPQATLRRIDPASDFAPTPPRWEGDGVSLEGGHVTLHFTHDQPSQVAFTILRDGIPAAHDVSETTWKDPELSATTSLHEYSVEAVGRDSHLSSHPLTSKRLEPADRLTRIAATTFKNIGGDLKEGSHFMNWGKPGDELLSPEFSPKNSGPHLVRFEFANGAGPVNTGITCALKHLEIRELGSGKVVSSNYMIFPQSGDWNRHDLTIPFRVSLDNTKHYQIRLHEDEWSRNMSYLSQNSRYTSQRGGGDFPSHFVDIFSLQILQLEP